MIAGDTTHPGPARPGGAPPPPVPLPPPGPQPLPRPQQPPPKPPSTLAAVSRFAGPLLGTIGALSLLDVAAEAVGRVL